MGVVRGEAFGVRKLACAFCRLFENGLPAKAAASCRTSGRLRRRRTDMLSGFVMTGALFIRTCIPGYAQEEIRLWEGKAPGSENYAQRHIFMRTDWSLVNGDLLFIK